MVKTQAISPWKDLRVAVVLVVTESQHALQCYRYLDGVRVECQPSWRSDGAGAVLPFLPVESRVGSICDTVNQHTYAGAGIG
jgi:hypothetical protein